VDRNCDTTSCPATDSTAIVSSGATVVVVATSTGTAATQGSCANGWYLCAASAGGGCCPSGYLCGSSCTATASGEQNTGKEAPSSASVVGWAWSFFVLAIGTGIGMVWL
jgi:progranulin